MAKTFVIVLLILSIISFLIILFLGLMNFPLFVMFVVEIGILATLLTILERLERLEFSRNRSIERKKYGQTKYTPRGSRHKIKTYANQNDRKDQALNTEIEEVPEEDRFKVDEMVYEKGKAIKLTITDVKSNNRYELKDDNDTILFRYHHELLKSKPNNN